MQSQVMGIKELNNVLEKCSDQEVLSAKEHVICQMQQLTKRYSMLNMEPVPADIMELLVSDIS